MAHVAHAQLHEIAAAKFTIDAQIEQREIAGPHVYLEPYANGPDALDLQGRLLTDKLSLVPRRSTNHGNGRVHLVLLFWLKGGPSWTQRYPT